jgi:DNA polymerase-3 subunit delta
MLHLYIGSTRPNRDSDDFRLHEAYRALRVELDTDGMLELNTVNLAARGLTPHELISHITTVPFLANARLVVVEGLLGVLGSSRGVTAEWQLLLDALQLLPETNHLLLLEPARTRDERTVLARSPLLRALQALVEVETQSFEALRLGGRGGNEVAAWLLERAGRCGIVLEPSAAERLSELLGTDLWALSNELEKLAQYATGRTIGVDDVELLTTASRDQDIFAIIDDAVEGRAAPALLRLRRLLEVGSGGPARVQSLIARQLRNLIRASELLEQGASHEEIGRATGVTHPFPLRRLIDQASVLGRTAAERGLRSVEAADHAVKTGRYPDVLALEILLVSALSRRSGASTPRVR